MFSKSFFIRVTNSVKYTDKAPPIMLRMINKGSAYQCHCCTGKGSNGVLSNMKIKAQATNAAVVQLVISDFLTFLEITSTANKKPANGLTNRIATAAVTPAQINSRLYDCAEKFCLYARLPTVAVATTEETSIPVEPPKITVRNPLIRCEGALNAGRCSFLWSSVL